MRMRQLLCVLAALAVTGGIAAADGGTPAAEPASVPLFTNEDLEKYGPSDAPDHPVADTVASGNQDWTFVNKFIDGQYEKIKSEREYSLELSEREGRRNEPEWDGWNGRLLLAPRSPLWWHQWYAPPIPTPYDKHGVRTPSARAGRPIESGHYVSRRSGGGRSRGSGHGRGTGGGGGSRK